MRFSLSVFDILVLGLVLRPQIWRFYLLSNVLGLVVLGCLGVLLFSILPRAWIFKIGTSGLIGLEVPFVCLFDGVREVCLYMLLCCGGLALFYCHHYFGGDSVSSLLFPLIVWFLSVMGLLILSGSLFFSLIF